MWRSDLRAILNLARTRDGLTVLVSIAIVLVCTAIGSAALSSIVLLDATVVEAVRNDDTGQLPQLLYGLTLMLPLALVFGIGTSAFRHELYAAPHAPMFLIAPISGFRIIVRAFVRTIFGWLLFGLALGLPPILGLAKEASIGAVPALVFPISVLLALAPLVAVQALFEVVIVRWFSGARLRFWVTLVQVTVLLVLGLLVVAGIVKGSEISEWLAQWMQTESAGLPWILEAPAALMAVGAGESQSAGLLWSNLALAAIPIPFLWLTARLYRRSFEVYCVTVTPVRAQRVRRVRWPTRPLRSLLRLGFVAAVRVKSNVVANLFLIVLMVIALSQSSVGDVRVDQEQVPPAVRDAFSMLANWQTMMLILATLLSLSVIGDEQRHAALLATAPLPRSSLLQSKLLFTGLPFVSCYVTVIVCAPFVTSASFAAVALFAIAAPPVLLSMLAVVTMVGTWPTAIRLHSDTPLAGSLHSILPVVTTAVVCGLGMYPVLRMRKEMVASYYDHGLLASWEPATAGWMALGAGWAVGISAMLLGYVVGLRNLERLLGPQS